MSSIEWGVGGGAWGGEASILLNEQRALAPTQTDTNSTSELREEGCVCMSVEERQGEAIGYPSKTGRLRFHRCRFCAPGLGVGVTDGGGGSLSGRSELSDEGTRFSPGLSWLPQPGWATGR